MRRALDLLDRADYLPGVLCCMGEPSCLIDGQAWINWQTAEALERRRLVRIEHVNEGGDIYPAQPKGEPPSGL
jgi:hypothetical protein